jgi:hypothetical protein
MSKTPVPGPDRERCFQHSECAHADPRGEFAHTEPVTRPVTDRKNANASPQRRSPQDDGPSDKPLSG